MDDIAPLVRDWVTGWAVARSAAPPDEAPWGYTIDVGEFPQVRRYVFPDADEALVAAFMKTASVPGTWLRVFLPRATVEPWLAPGWSLIPPGFLMATEVTAAPVQVVEGYRLRTWTRAGLTRAIVTTDNGALAARGQAAVPSPEAPIVFDHIETARDHQRRGLGSLVMRALTNAGAEAGSTTAVLAATVEGQALYHHLGWKTHAPLTGLVYQGL